MAPPPGPERSSPPRRKAPRPREHDALPAHAPTETPDHGPRIPLNAGVGIRDKYRTGRPESTEEALRQHNVQACKRP